jgi:hypothetical protein
MNRLTCSIPEAGLCFDLGGWASYEAAKRGDFPTIKMGKRRKRVPIAALADQLGVSRDDVLTTIDEEKAKKEAAA